MSVKRRLCRTFADGFPNVFVKDATKIRNRHVAFLASFQDPASIFQQLSVIYQLPRMFVGSFTLVPALLPYWDRRAGAQPLQTVVLNIQATLSS